MVVATWLLQILCTTRYIVDGWSYSRVSSHAQTQKEEEESKIAYCYHTTKKKTQKNSNISPKITNFFFTRSSTLIFLKVSIVSYQYETPTYFIFIFSFVILTK